MMDAADRAFALELLRECAAVPRETLLAAIDELRAQDAPLTPAERACAHRFGLRTRVCEGCGATEERLAGA